MTSCPASCSRPATTLLSTPPDMATITRIVTAPSPLGVAGRSRQLHHEAIKLVRHDDLAAEPRGLGQAKGQIQHILLVLRRLLKLPEPGRVDDHMAGRAGERAFAGAFDIDAMLVGDFQNREPDRRVNLATGAITFDKSHFRHTDQALVLWSDWVAATAACAAASAAAA